MRHSTVGLHVRVDRWDVVFNARDEVLPSEGLDAFVRRIVDHEKTGKAIKADHRSAVTRFGLDGVEFVRKSFIMQKSWWWFKLTSLVFPTQAEIAWRNSFELAQAGFIVPPPVLLLQRIRYGLVTESRFYYRYIEGAPPEPADWKDIVNLLKRLHGADWVHRDPHPGNFIRTSQGIGMLDPVRLKKSGSRYLKAYDLVLLSHDIPEASGVYIPEGSRMWLHAAAFGHEIVRLYRALKHGARRLIGIGNKE